MYIQLHIYVLVACLLFSGKSRQVTGSETNLKTWLEAMLDCYGKNTFLESNINVLKNYINNHNGVQSVWVGSFKAILAWIEIKGCYNISLNSSDRDEKKASNPSVCQIKCIGRRYFAFSQHNERCVCFDEQGIVNNKGRNASLCQECINRKDCNTYAVAYEVVNRIINETRKEPVCLSYQCEYNGQIPIFIESSCDESLKSYCRNGQKAGNTYHLNFFDYLTACAEHHFSYPLLQEKNPIQLCNLSQAIATSIWVGVYRQILDVGHLGKTAQNTEDFDMIKDYISQCSHLSLDDGSEQTEGCSDSSNLRHYMCTTENSTNLAKDHISTSTPTSGCCSEGLIAGTVTSILVIVVVVVIVGIICGRRFNCRTPQLKGRKTQRKDTTQENNSDGQYHEIDITLGQYAFAKPLSDNNSRVKKAAEDDNAYSRIVSAVFDASNVTAKTDHCIANPGYNGFKISDNKTNPVGYQQSSNSLPNETRSSDYCLAKPISNPGDMNPYTDNADYDHLSNVKNREENTVQVYDHVPNIIDSDVTYDHSTMNISKSESDNYDHVDVQN